MNHTHPAAEPPTHEQSPADAADGAAFAPAPAPVPVRISAATFDAALAVHRYHANRLAASQSPGQSAPG